MRLDGTIRHGLDFNVGNAGSWTMSVAFGPVIVSGGGGVQSDWNESDTTSMAYIKNKPTNVSAFSNDAGYLNNNFCPIIEDTRSSNSGTITGNAPFSTLVDGQMIILHLKQNNSNNTLTLTLSDNTTTSAIPVKITYQAGVYSFTDAGVYAGDYYQLRYEQANSRWITIGRDRNNVYGSNTQAQITAGTDTTSRLMSPKLIHDNAYIVEKTYSSGSLKANKMYDLGEVTAALTIPDLDVTNDLVSNAMNFWALHFKVGELTPAGTTELSITFPQNPSGIIVDDEPTIKEGDYVEIMITKHTVGNDTDYYASIKVWQAQ